MTKAFVASLKKHRSIFWALLMRELSTRYGRDNIGFLWLVIEPIIFATGVSILWSLIRPPYENGIEIIPFVITGYLPLILVRQTVGYAVGAVKNNSDLLFHRMITPLHLLMARLFTEIIGVTLASVVIIAFYNIIGVMDLPKNFADLSYIYVGWFMLALLAASIGMIMAALAEIFDFVERFVQILTYVMIPLSGALVRPLEANMSSIRSRAARASAREGRAQQASSMYHRHRIPARRMAFASTLMTLVHRNGELVYPKGSAAQERSTT